MQNSLFNSNFAKHSKFDADFVGNINELENWHTLANQYEKYLYSSNKHNKKKKHIPKRIHQIWLGKKVLPPKYKKWMNTWKIINKDWDYKLWNENNIKELGILDFDIYSNDKNPGYRSDILRYILLERFGGIYIDTDFECIRPIPEALLSFKFISCTIFNNKPIIANGMIMSTPRYILLNKILTSIKRYQYLNDIDSIMKNTGPDKLTKEYFIISKEIAKETLILPSNYFYPFPNFMLNKRINKYDEIENESIGIHHWEMSWMKLNILKRIKNKLLKFAKILIRSFIKTKY